jgi:hypothetical protein
VGANREFNFDTILAALAAALKQIYAQCASPSSRRELTSEVARMSQHALGRGTDGSTGCSLFTRHLLFAVIAYRLQADRFDDLDHATTQVLDRTDAKEAEPVTSDRLASFDLKRTELTPGTVLVREWDWQSQRVMVMADGFAWNGRTYDSLSKVAFAITGTKWNGPRFFGFRDREDRSAAARFTRGSPPSRASTRSSIRWMPSTIRLRLISKVRPMPAGP